MINRKFVRMGLGAGSAALLFACAQAVPPLHCKVPNGLDKDVFNELLSSMINPRTGRFSPLLFKGDTRYRPFPEIFRTEGDRGERLEGLIASAPRTVVYVLDDSGVDSNHLDVSPFSYFAYTYYFTHVTTRGNPLVGPRSIDSSANFFSADLEKYRTFEGVFAAYSARSKWLAPMRLKIEKIEAYCAVGLFYDNGRLAHVASVYNTSETHPKFPPPLGGIRELESLVCARRAKAALAGFEELSLTRLRALAVGSRDHRDYGYRVNGVPESWRKVITVLRALRPHDGATKNELCALAAKIPPK
jgi:hypothetical protein